MAKEFATRAGIRIPSLDHPAEISPMIGPDHSYVLKVVENGAQGPGPIYPGRNAGSFSAGRAGVEIANTLPGENY